MGTLLFGVLMQINTGGSLKDSFNSILEDYAVPAILFLLIGSVVGGMLANLDKIQDTKGQGTKKEGYMNVAYIVGGVVVFIFVVGAVIRMLTGFSLQID